jgi:RNA polymerase sigma factor (TIGR02999 family)
VTDRPRSVTHLLEQARAGDPDALNRLLPLVYDQLRAVAARALHAERPGHTLQPTALVHEAYMRLVDQRAPWRDRAHFFAIAAQAMHRILVDYARAHRASKRGGAAPRVSLDETADGPAQNVVELDDVLEIDEALEALAALDPLEARVVELRYFGGLTIEESAEALNLSPATVKREWRMARAWLYRRLSGGSPRAR